MKNSDKNIRKLIVKWSDELNYSAKCIKIHA